MPPGRHPVQTGRAAGGRRVAAKQADDEPISERERRLHDRLDALGIAHRTVEHEATHTVAESAGVKAHLAGGHAKTLLVADKRAPWLIVAAASARADLRGVGRRLACEGYSLVTYLASGALNATLDNA